MRKIAHMTSAEIFEKVKTVSRALTDVEASTKYDGSPVFKVRWAGRVRASFS